MISINIQVETADDLNAVKAFFTSSVSPLVLHAATAELVCGTVLQAEAPIDEAATEAEQPKENVVQRRRRTKAEMEAARAAEASTSPTEPGPTIAPEEQPEQEVEEPTATELPEQEVPQQQPAAATAPVEPEQQPDTNQAWDMATLKNRIGGLQTYMATPRTLEILSGFGINIEQIAPAPGATITPILQHLGTKNLTGLIDLGQEKVNQLITIYDALMKG